MREGHRLGVDVGGTFTDVVLSTRGDDLVTAKVPTTDPQDEGVLAGVERACDRAGVDPSAVSEFTHATTVSVNALLEEDGARTALVTTEGFGDVLEIGRQDRASLYDLDARKPEPLVPRQRRFELPERATPDGVEQPVDADAVREIAARIDDVDPPVEAVAVCLLHAYADPANERAVADVLDAELDVPVSVSHEVVREFREYERASTTVVDAYVKPTFARYIGRLLDSATEAGLPRPLVMRSNGGVAAAETARETPASTVLSGPAAGVVGAGAAAGDLVEERDLAGLVTFDMGGTSTDVSLVRDGGAERAREHAVAGRPLRLPTVDVNTVGAGGGSIAWVDDGGALRVGPQSAGAEPGPACYGRGGTEPTVTDAALALGYVGAGAELGGEITLDRDAALDALADLAAESDLEGSIAAARGVHRVAVANMARAVRSVTVERGHDPREHGLVAFGGAGPMHAAALADALGATTVVVPPASGVLSAYGLLAADETHDAARTYRTQLADADPDAVAAEYDALADEALADARNPGATTVRRRADCRYDGQRFDLTVDVDDTGDSFDREAVEARFHDAHEAAYGYRMDEPVELVTLRVTATAERDAPAVDRDAGTDAVPSARREATFDETGRQTPVYERDALPAGWVEMGPTVVEGGQSTTVVPPGWRLGVRDDGALVLAEVSP